MTTDYSWSSGYAFVSGAGGLKLKFLPVKLNTVLPKARHHCNISSNGAVLPGRHNAKTGIYTLRLNSEYKERFGVKHNNLRS